MAVNDHEATFAEYLEGQDISAPSRTVAVASVVEITKWPSLVEPRGRRSAVTWSALASELAKPAPRPSDPEKPALGGWSPATFRDDRRAKAGVLDVTALVLDLDKPLPLERVREAFASRCAVVHNTRRSRPDAQRWRIVLATSRAMTSEEYAIVWAAERARLASLGIVLDEATKDASRFWFVACEPREGAFLCERIEGGALDVDAIIAQLRSATSAPTASTASAALRTTEAPVSRTTVAEDAEVARISMSTRKRRAAKYLVEAETATSGDRGHSTTMRVVTAAVRGFALDDASAREVLDDWNARCSPPWSARELEHKIDEAVRVGDLAWGEKLRAEPKAANAREPRAPRTIEVLDASDLATPLPDVDYLVPALGLASGAPALVAGYGYSGKTISLQSLALSIAAGRPVWGVYSARRGRVLHLDFEQGERVTKGRYQRLARGMNVDLAELGGALRVAVNPVVYLDDEDALDVYARLFEGHSLVIVDSLRAAAQRADENASEVRRSIDLMNRAAEPHGALVVFVHHSRKPKADDPDGARYKIRGSSALFDACGSVFVFSAEKGQPTRVEHEKCRNRGVTVDDFGLSVEDVELGGVPKAGLRVVHLEAAQFAAAQSSARSPYAEAKRRILDFLRAAGTFRGAKSSLCAQIRMGRTLFFAAMAELESRGEVESSKDEVGAFVRPLVLGSPAPSRDWSGPNGTADERGDDSTVRPAGLGGRTVQTAREEVGDGH